jgi:hypothetical protein
MLEFNCALKNLFDGRAEADTCIGALSKLKIGDTDVPAMKAKGCIGANGKPTEIKAGITTFSWDGTATSPIVIEGVVNSANRGKLEEVKLKLNKLKVEFGFKILRTADDDSTWFEGLTGETLTGVLDKNVGLGALWVATERDKEGHGATETLYRFRIMIAPDVSKSQQMQYAGAAGSPQPVAWGQPLAA